MEAKFQCPKCERPIVSRRNQLCQYCGAELPESLLFTKAEIEALDREWTEEQNQRTAQRKREEAERERDGGGDAGFVNF
jgi:hypothetical protein